MIGTPARVVSLLLGVHTSRSTRYGRNAMHIRERIEMIDNVFITPILSIPIFTMTISTACGGLSTNNFSAYLVPPGLWYSISSMYIFRTSYYHVKCANLLREDGTCAVVFHALLSYYHALLIAEWHSSSSRLSNFMFWLLELQKYRRWTTNQCHRRHARGVN